MKLTILVLGCVALLTVEISSHHLKKKHPHFIHKFKGGLLGAGLLGLGAGLKPFGLGGGFKPYGLGVKPFAGLPTGFQGPVEKFPVESAAAEPDTVAINVPQFSTSNIAQIFPQNLPVYSEPIDSLYAGSIPLQYLEEDGQGRQSQTLVGPGNNQGLPFQIAIPIGAYNPTDGKEQTQTSSPNPEPNKDKKPEKQLPLVIFPQNQIPNQLAFLQLLQQLGQVVMIVPGQAPVQPVFPVQSLPPQQQQQQNGFGQQQQQNFGSKQPYQPQGFYSPGAFLPGNPPYYNSVYLQPQPIQGEDEVALAHSDTPTTSPASTANVPQDASYVVPAKTRDQKVGTKTKKAREDTEQEESPALV